jgi:hypothetical protein
VEPPVLHALGERIDDQKTTMLSESFSCEKDQDVFPTLDPDLAGCVIKHGLLTHYLHNNNPLFCGEIAHPLVSA